MPDMDLSIIATRPELDNISLELNDHLAFEVVTFGPAARIRRNTYARSGNAEGAEVTNSVLDLTIRPLVVRVLATTQALLTSRTAQLIETVEQTSWHLTVTRDTQVTTYNCMTCESIAPADPSGGNRDEWDTFQLLAKQHAYRIAIPTQPRPLAGPI